MKLESLGIATAVSTKNRAGEHVPASSLGLVQLRPVIEAGGQPLLVLDDDDRVELANKPAAAMLGFEIAELEQRRLREQISVGASPLPLLLHAGAGIARVALEGAHGRCVLANMQLLYDRRGTATHVCLLLEEPRNLRPSLNALEALGRLAAELGHEINNQLAAALNYASIVQRRLGPASNEAEHMVELQQALWRASGWASSLRLVGRQRSAQPEGLRIDEVIAALEPLLRHLSGNVELELDLGSGDALVEAPRTYLEQMVVGVILHALGRTPGVAQLTLRTRKELDSASAEIVLRLSCEAHGADTAVSAVHSTRAQRGRSVLHRALKHCHGRLDHDTQRIWVDLAIATGA